MKKIILPMVILSLMSVYVNAYNPPINGENFFELSSPNTLTGANSAAGNSMNGYGPESLIVNPALTANEQRTILNLAYTQLFSTREENSNNLGAAFQAGLLIPFKLYIVSAYFNGTFINLDEMDLGNSLNAKVGLSKEITDKLNVGLGINGGVIFDDGVDWALSANLGFAYKYGQLAFLKSFRFGASVLNLGKGYPTNIACSNALYNDEETYMLGFPTIGMIKTGVAANFFETENMNFGFSFDLSTPLFLNLICDLGLQFAFKDLIFVNIAEKINLRESIAGHANYIPSIGLNVKFQFNAKNNTYLENNGWSQSEMRVSAAYKNMYKTVNAISAGADLYLGLPDETPPVINLWLNEEDEE